MYGAKCLIAEAIPSASSSHGSQLRWCDFSLRLKQSAGKRSLPLHVKRVAPIPAFTGDASTVSISLSSGVGIVRTRGDFKASLHRLKCSSNSSVHVTCWEPLRPLIDSSNGEARLEYLGIQRDIALKAPMNDRILLHVLGGSVESKGVILCGEIEIVPDVHFHPRTLKVLGHTRVLTDDKESPFLLIFSKTLSQFCKSSSGVLEQMYRSSAII